jgi:hypothetical protein
VAGSTRRPAILLAAVGGLFVITGIAGLIGGLFLAGRLYSLLPPVNVDQRAVGGAVFALGVSIGLGGVLHLLLAVPLLHGRRGAIVPAVVLCVAMAMFAVTMAVAALVSVAAGTGVPAALMPVAIALLALAAAYAMATVDLIRRRGTG